MYKQWVFQFTILNFKNLLKRKDYRSNTRVKTYKYCNRIYKGACIQESKGIRQLSRLIDVHPQ